MNTFFLGQEGIVLMRKKTVYKYRCDLLTRSVPSPPRTLLRRGDFRERVTSSTIKYTMLHGYGK